MKKKLTVDVELETYFDEQGSLVSYLFLGEEEEPSLTQEESLLDIVNKEIDMYSVRGVIHPNHHESLNAIADKLQEVSTYIKNKLEQ